MSAPIYAVVWTERNGRQAEFHYGSRATAGLVAALFRGGWRKDARVETRP